uniref:ShKT domain-containing protein n=1 Tax=Panagrolaimus sp. ES5 TaxID=591445 RepID=A0AC34GXJ5_9BILA
MVIIADCQDTATNCLENLENCFDPAQYDAMYKVCRCTCSFCPAPETQCQDIDPECVSKAYECDNHRYKPLMCRYCRKTCRLCDDPCSLLP